MPKQKIINLITDLHNTFGDDLASPQQRQLLEQVVMLAHKLDEPDQALGFNESVALLLHEVGEDHPHAAALLRQVVKLLGDMGI